MKCFKQSRAIYKWSFVILIFTIVLLLYSIPYIFNNPFGVKRNWHYQGRDLSTPVQCNGTIIFASLDEKENIVVRYLKRTNDKWKMIQEFIPNDFQSYNLENILINKNWLVLVARKALSTYPLRFAINVGTESDMYYINQSKERWDTISYFIYERKNDLWEYSRTIETMRNVHREFCLYALSNENNLFYDDIDPDSGKITIYAEDISKNAARKKLPLPTKLLSRHQIEYYKIALFHDDDNSLLIFDYNTAFSDNDKTQYHISENHFSISHGDCYYYRYKDGEWKMIDLLYRHFIANDKVYKNHSGNFPIINGVRLVSQKEIALIEAIPDVVMSLNQSLKIADCPKHVDVQINQDDLASPVYLFNIEEQFQVKFNKEITYKEFYQLLSDNDTDKELYFSFDNGKKTLIYEYDPKSDQKHEIFRIP